MKVIGSPLPGGDRAVEIDELWSVHSFEGDYNPIHDHGTKTLMGISTTCWTKVPKEISDGNTREAYNLYNASGDSDGCLAFNYGRNSMQEERRTVAANLNAWMQDGEKVSTT